MNDLEFIREECMKANPLKVFDLASDGHRVIHLADVMLTISNMLVIVDCDGNFYQLKMRLADRMPTFESCLGKWSLFDDDLDDQHSTTHKFIANLLRK